MKIEDFIYEMKKKKNLKFFLCCIDLVLQNSLGRNWERKKDEDMYFVT